MLLPVLHWQKHPGCSAKGFLRFHSPLLPLSGSVHFPVFLYRNQRSYSLLLPVSASTLIHLQELLCFQLPYYPVLLPAAVFPLQPVLPWQLYFPAYQPALYPQSVLLLPEPVSVRVLPAHLKPAALHNQSHQSGFLTILHL